MYKPARLHDASSHTAAMSRALMTQCSSGVGSFPMEFCWTCGCRTATASCSSRRCEMFRVRRGVCLLRAIPRPCRQSTCDSAALATSSRDRSSPAAIWPGCSTSSPPAAGLRPATQSRPGRALGNRDPRTAKYRLPHVQPQPGVEGSDAPELSVVPSLLADRRDQICGLARRRQDPIGFSSPTHA
jgi:hypothetical protein